MFLSDSDIADLTGLVRKSAQIRWLRANGYTCEVGADGKPKVLISHVNARLGGSIDGPATEPLLHL